MKGILGVYVIMFLTFLSTVYATSTEAWVNKHYSTKTLLNLIFPVAVIWAILQSTKEAKTEVKGEDNQDG